MSLLPWKHHFFTSTRGRIILLLRRASRTVDELARELGLTDNAVRAHLLTLERDGLVCQIGTRRGSGKPAQMYDLTPGADQLFPQAYPSILQELLAVLSEGMASQQREELMQQVGRRLARQWYLLTPGDLPDRLQAALVLLNDLGGVMEVEEGADAMLLQGYRCPVAALAPAHPEVCKLVQALLSEFLGAPVTELCGQQSEQAHCCFRIARL